MTLRGQAVLSETECAVEVYDESIRTLAESSRYQERTLTTDEALDAHLAHEFSTSGSFMSTAPSWTGWKT